MVLITILTNDAHIQASTRFIDCGQFFLFDTVRLVMNFSFCKFKSEEYDEEGEKKRILLECRDGRKSPLNTSEEEDEKEEKKRKLLESREDENFQPKRRWKELVSKWNWRNLILASVLWVAELFMYSAYSLIAPFFPSAV